MINRINESPKHITMNVQTSLFLSTSSSSLTDETIEEDHDWKNLMMSSTLTSFVLPPPPPKQLLIVSPEIRDIVTNLIDRLVISEAANNLVTLTLNQSYQCAINFANLMYGLSNQNQLDSIQPDSGWDSSSDSDSEKEDPTYTGTSKYIDDTDWSSSRVQHYTNGNCYLGAVNEKGQPHGNGKMKRTATVTSTSTGKHRNWRGVKKVDDILIPTSTKHVTLATKKYLPCLDHLDNSINGKMSEFFDGKWIHGKFVEGMWRVQSGDSYTGTFNNEWMFHGAGKYLWGDGESYEGDWVRGNRHGKGTYIHIDGSVYEGDWKDNKENGAGTKKWNDGKHYKGEWKDGSIHGMGNLTFSNGGMYHGMFEHDQKQGKGLLHWSNGYCYEGMFHQDQLHGIGTIKLLNPGNMDFGTGTVVYQGSFENGKKETKNGIEHFPDGSKYEGGYVAGLPDGIGAWTGPELRPFAAIVRNEAYEGEFKAGKRHGRGKMTTFEGEFLGWFKNDVPHGTNRFTAHNGDESYHGNWQLGKKHGKGEFWCF